MFRNKIFEWPLDGKVAFVCPYNRYDNMFSEMRGAIKACLTSGHGDKGTSSPWENPFTKATRKQNTTSVQNSAR